MSEVNKYNNSKIYKIWSPSRDDLVYYGSTFQSLSQRMSIHRSHYRRFKVGNGNKCSSFKIFEECDDYRIDLVESYPCNSKEELNSKEGEYIKNNMCVNKNVAGRTLKEYYQEHREEAKQYREANIEKINASQKKYREDHKEERKEHAKEHYEANKEKINARRRELRKLKKEENPQ